MNNMKKNTIVDLAIFGAQPAFQDDLHVGRPNCGNREHLFERINDILDRKWFSNNGRYVQEFEKKIAQQSGTKHCIAVCNGTVGLEIAVRALGLTGEVIMPSFTFAATAHAVQWIGITPVFCDINPDTYNIDAAKIEKLITPKTTGIVGVHLFGRPCDIEALSAIAQRHNLKLLFDAAHAVSVSCKGKMIGGFGDAEVFSFHATKFLNAFEGGAIVTNNDELATKMRSMKNFGYSGNDNISVLGINGKMSEVCAAMGLTNLESIEKFVAINLRNYKLYERELVGLYGVKLMQFDQAQKNNYQYLVIEIDDETTQISRDQLVKILHTENVLAKRYYYPGCHRVEPYCSQEIYKNIQLPETERIAQRTMSLPTGTAVGEKEISAICQIIRFSIENVEQIQEKIS
ncbi:DegT/DnrJ/EryC1/StrS family aminotransferase [Candidatus Omnitrophota bacterium]